MAPIGFAVLIGAGPTSGAGIARVLADPSLGNMAVALLARNAENLTSLCEGLRRTSNGGVLHPFPCDTAPANLRRVFGEIRSHADFSPLKLKLAVYHVKHALRKPFLDTTPEEFERSLSEYTTGAFAFAQEALKLMYAQSGGAPAPLSADNPDKKGTIVFTGTLGAMRTNAGYAAYGAGRSATRMVAQALGKEHSANGIHVVHAIANGAIQDISAEEDVAVRTGKKMSAESVGKMYLWLSRMEPDLWIDELDLRPAQERW
ncbi:short-chain dehydrogenase/reductase SDR [Biscogniauxia marginata]|nr:short-chain dehydrogenase/reductase SDR [Biscogniauxia marginata]